MLQHYETLKDYMNKGYVFKRCYGNLYNCTVVLTNPDNDFKCNEFRSKIGNLEFAKFRCNGLITVAIYDLKLKIIYFEFASFCSSALVKMARCIIQSWRI